MDKGTLLERIDSLRLAVVNNDVEAICAAIDDFKIDTNRTSPLADFTRGVVIEAIKDYVEKNGGRWKVTRKNVYHEDTFDVYTTLDEVLVRNMVNAKYTSLGKLLSAYRKIETN